MIMRKLTDRTDIGRVINFKKYPVITIDVSKRDEYGIVGCPVCVDAGFFRSGEPYYVHATCRVYRDKKILQVNSFGACLSNDFGYRNIEEMLQYANAPVIKPDSDVLVVIIDSETRTACAPVVLHTSKNVDPHCSTPIMFTEDLSFAGFFKDETWT